MINQRRKDIFQNKGFYISLLTGAVCVIAVVIVSLNVISDRSNNDLPNLNEPMEFSEEQGDGITEDEAGLVDEENIADVEDLQEDGIVEPEEGGVADTPTDAEAEVVPQEENLEDRAEEAINNESANQDEEPTVPVMGTENEISNLSFQRDEELLWPVTGNIIMKYSMSSTIYHQTLGQYRCNPGILIESAVGTEVLSAYDCIVTDIAKNEEIGTIVKTSIGDEYTLLYGQLENLGVSVGDYLKEGDVIGTIAKPTKYYVEEGSNLFFQVFKGEETIDPMLLLR